MSTTSLLSSTAPASLPQDVEVPVSLPRGLRTPEANVYIGAKDQYLERLRIHNDPNGPPFRQLPNGSIVYIREELDRWLENLPKLSSAKKRRPYNTKKRAAQAA